MQTEDRPMQAAKKKRQNPVGETSELFLMWLYGPPELHKHPTSGAHCLGKGSQLSSPAQGPCLWEERKPLTGVRAWICNAVMPCMTFNRWAHEHLWVPALSSQQEAQGLLWEFILQGRFWGQNCSNTAKSLFLGASTLTGEKEKEILHA